MEFKCDQYEYVAATEKGLKQHIRMKHKELPPRKEILRSSEVSRRPLDCSSPVLSNTREELCQNCETPFSSSQFNTFVEAISMKHWMMYLRLISRNQVFVHVAVRSGAHSADTHYQIS